MKSSITRKILAWLLAAVTLSAIITGCTPAQDSGTDNTTTPADTTLATPPEKDDIIVLFTNDVHCAVDNNIGYSGLASYKKYCESLTPHVALVDCGDAVQGGLVGAVSSGEYIVDIMNQVGYDLAVLGNHEFDYGMTQLQNLIKKADATYLCSNITYSGKGENKLSDVKPYEIMTYGNVDVAFIGVSTPYTITASTPVYFQEDGEFVYDFGKNEEDFYTRVQKYVDECEQKGAEYVILMTHLGNTDAYSPYSSDGLIAHTDGVDAALDAHAHNTIPCEVKKNKNGENVLLSSTGTQLSNIGQLTISSSGNVSVGLISDYDETDSATSTFIDSIKASYEERLSAVVATSKVNLTGYDENGIRLVRNRETNVGNFCADAYRAVAGADIAFVNGGGVRADIKAGNVTYADMIAVHPFGNTLCMVEATGQEILDALEISMYAVEKEYQQNGEAYGENGSFQHCSGIRFTVDTSIASTVTFDENFMVSSLGENRRVCNVEVLGADGNYSPIDPNGTYKVASHNYMLADSGCSHNIFADNVFLIDRSMADYEILLNYVKDFLGGVIGEEYASTEGRITIK